MTRRTALGALAGLALTAAGSAAEAAEPWKIVETARSKDIRWRDMVKSLAQCDVVFVGEQHDDPETHRLEAMLFMDLHKRVKERLTLAMEMFERDQQRALDDYLAGRIDEATFAKTITLWKNYPTDYRPMVEYAKANQLPVVGSNAPQKFVRQVGRQGLASLSTLTDAEKPLVAGYVNAPAGDEYQKRFYATMQGMGDSHGGGMDPAMLRRIYEAQCLRDDTMAESIARALTPGRLVYHVNGSFHSDAGLGTAARLRWRRPVGVKVGIVKVIPSGNEVQMTDGRSPMGEADFVVYVPDKRPKAPEKPA